MSFKTNESQQISLNDRLNNLTQRERRILSKSWATPFAEQVFPKIDERRFEALYSNDNGRPNTPVNVVVGALFLKELTRVTDEELLDSIIFDIRYQYALHLTSSDEIPVSDRTVSRFRERLYLHEMNTGEDLMKEEIERLSKEFAKILGISGKLKRMDSLMIASSCKKMGRLELMYTCIANLVKALKESGETEKLPAHMLDYIKENKNAVCYRLTQEEAQTRLESVAADGLLLYELAADLQGGTEDFQILERMLKDQTENGQLKPNHKVSPQSLQNPSDEDATFRRKSGVGHQGYVGNLVEDCGEGVNIITQYEYDVNVHSDADFGREIIEELGKQEESVVLITDGAYGNEDNFDSAAANNIELVPTALIGQAPPEIVLDFTIEENVIVSCPDGHTPIEANYNEEKGLHSAKFEKETCENCPLREQCTVVINKRTASVKISTTTINRAEYVSKLTTETYKEYAKKRNGVEGVPSVLRRRYGVDDMPVRGLVRSKLWFGFKIAAINIKRLFAATKNKEFALGS